MGGMDAEVDSILVAASELKQPLIDIRQLAFAFDGMTGENEAIRAEMIGISDRAIAQINDLMKLQKLKNGAFELEPVGVRAICDRAKQKVRGELITKYKNRTPLVMANRELLESVIFNFLFNAEKYNCGGERALLMVRDVRDKVEIIVRDYGPAIPCEIWREMKRGWIRKPKAIAMRPGSSGLGLYIASRFAEYMNAKVGAVRHRDGTSFYVELMKTEQRRLF